jgi:quaternary ammonium compound-resistance protein SugE
MPWTLLVLAGLFEIAWAIGLKYSAGFTRPGPTTFTLVTLALSMVLLGLAAKDLPIGTAYAVWTGIGAIGTAVLGMWLLGEPVTLWRLVSIGLIVAGIAGLKLSGN